MDKIRQVLKPHGETQKRQIAATNEWLRQKLRDDPGMFKPQLDGRLWTVCPCINAQCPGQRRKAYSAGRLACIIQKSPALQLVIDRRIWCSIDSGASKEPEVLFQDESSYTYKVEVPNKERQLYIMKAQIKIRRGS